MTELIFFGLKFAAAALFTAAVMLVVGYISGLLAACAFFPPSILSILQASVLCAAVSAAYRLFFA